MEPNIISIYLLTFLIMECLYHGNVDITDNIYYRITSDCLESDLCSDKRQSHSVGLTNHEQGESVFIRLKTGRQQPLGLYQIQTKPGTHVGKAAMKQPQHQCQCSKKVVSGGRIILNNKSCACLLFIHLYD